MYPIQSQRKPKMMELARKAGLLEMTLAKKINNTPMFHPYYEKALEIHNANPDLTMLEIVTLAISFSNEDIKKTGQYYKLGMLRDFYELTEAGLGYEGDLHFMIIDWYIEESESGKRPVASHFPLGDGPHTNSIISSIEELARHKAMLSSMPIRTQQEQTSAIQKVIKDARDYWIKNVRESPIDSYPILTGIEVKVNYSSKLEEILTRNLANNALCFLRGGGIRYRECIAEVACKDMETALEIGTGDGFAQPAIASRGNLVAIDPLYLIGADEVAEQLRKEGRAIAYKNERLENYDGKADVAIITDGHFLDVSAVEHLNRVAKYRVVMGIPSLQRPLMHFLRRNDTIKIGNHMHKISSFEPMRWAKELGKYFTITTYNYENKFIILKAEREVK